MAENNNEQQDGFTPITSQEQLNSVISARLKRERETIENKYSDYSALKGQVEALNASVNDLTEKLKTANGTISANARDIASYKTQISKYETDSAKTRIALEAGLPYEMAARLNGSTEEELRTDAENVLKLMGGIKPPTAPPLKDTETPGAGSGDDAYIKMARSLKGE